MDVNRIVLLLAGGLLALSMSGCGSSDDDAEPITFDDWVGSFTYDYDPASSLADLSARSTVAAQATLVDIEDGAIFGSSPDDAAASHSVNLVFESGNDDRYYVELPRPAYIGIDALRSVMPLGSASVIYLQPNQDPRAENYFNVREGPTWFFTTPQGWILDGPDRDIVTPLEGSDSLGFDPPPGGDTNLEVWLVDPKEAAA